MVELTFHGAARTVTGSKYLLHAGQDRVLFDCGLFQGQKELRLKNWDRLPFSPGEIDAVVLTHAHIDHTGFLPRLVALGYRGPVLASPATRRLSELLLLDSAENQERDADYANRKGYSRHHPALPLYTAGDARAALKLFESRPRGKWHQAAGAIWFRYHDAGHLLGSNMVEVEVRSADAEEGRQAPLRILFSGDVGRYGGPLYHDPAPPPACDYLICESTYGDRDHPDGNLLEELRGCVQRATRRRGVMLVASFSVGRAQQLIYLLQILMHEKRIPELPIFLDSPMAIDATEIYRDFGEDHDLSEGQLLGRDSVLDGPQLTFARTVADSKKINRISGPAVIISSSGMMTGGRILHHLRQRLSDSRNTILLAGFMAEGTRGRRLQNGEKTLRMHGKNVPVAATVERISGLSGHADRGELLQWLAPLPAPKCTFLTHGEVESANALADTLRTDRGWEVVIPRLGKSFKL